VLVGVGVAVAVGVGLAVLVGVGLAVAVGVGLGVLVGGVGGRTVRVAEAGPPFGVPVPVTRDVMLRCAPSTVPDTWTTMSQDWPAASTFEVLKKVPAPGLMLKVPPPVARVLQVPLSCVTSWIPAGIVSLNWTLDTGTAFGFVTVIVAVEAPLRATVDGLKLLLIVRASACASRRSAESRARRATRTRIGVKEWCDRARVHRAAPADLVDGCCTAFMSLGSYTRSLATIATPMRRQMNASSMRHRIVSDVQRRGSVTAC
jgi:hypothetical protein